MKARQLAALGFAWLIGCAQVPPAADPRTQPALDPGPLRPVSTFPFDFQWRQHVTARWPKGSQGFDAVLLKREGRLTLMGLSPLGIPGFILRLGLDGEPQLENRTGKPLPFPPEYVLADVQRVFFPWLEPPPRSFQGERTGRISGLTVRERYVAGQLVERRFERDDAQERGEVRILYQGFQAGFDVPTRVELENQWFRYALTIETLEQTRL